MQHVFDSCRAWIGHAAISHFKSFGCLVRQKTYFYIYRIHWLIRLTEIFRICSRFLLQPQMFEAGDVHHAAVSLLMMQKTLLINQLFLFLLVWSTTPNPTIYTLHLHKQNLIVLTLLKRRDHFRDHCWHHVSAETDAKLLPAAVRS